MYIEEQLKVKHEMVVSFGEEAVKGLSLKE